MTISLRPSFQRFDPASSELRSITGDAPSLAAVYLAVLHDEPTDPIAAEPQYSQVNDISLHTFHALSLLSSNDPQMPQEARLLRRDIFLKIEAPLSFWPGVYLHPLQEKD
ncbi:hypothetical protein D3C73_953590 [compost metagenome]